VSSETKDFTNKSEYLAGIIVKAANFAKDDPETALMYARKSAECICSNIFYREIGDPGNNRLDKLIELLANQKKLPERIKIPLRVIQQYGNYGAHVQADQEHITRYFVEPCIMALFNVSNWYFHDYLDTDIPPLIANIINDFEPEIQESERSIASPECIAGELSLPSPLRTYQWEGVCFLSGRESALLADEMGLGKTIQAIVALRAALHGSISKRALIITPSSLTYNWEQELTKWGANLTLRRVRGSFKDRQATYQLPIQILIASYDQIRTDAIHMSQNLKFEVVIIDEAQRIKNRYSRTALACRLIHRKKSWALSGTPLENSVDDLESIFLFLSSGLIDAGMSPKEIQSRIRNHFLRRRKKEVLDEMPPIVIQDISLELSDAQDVAYTDVWLQRREIIREFSGVPVSETALFALITKLKQICNYEPQSGESVKWETLAAILENLSEKDDKVIVFSQYVDTLKFIAKKMGTFPYDLYTGELSQELREKALKSFRSKEGPRALLVSLRAGGVGLNIQEASIVILFDRWWNPAIEEQAIQRAHRFGRERHLYVIRFLVMHTIEERINEVLEEKKIDFEVYVENAENAPIEMLTKDELRRILRISSIETD
jgi:SNF2 family DNA or RNA helicase